MKNPNLTFLLCLFLLLNFSTLYGNTIPKRDSLQNDHIFADSYEFPEFPSGDLQKWIKRHLTYPRNAFNKGIEGKVFISFCIEADGSISDIKVRRTPDTLLNDAATQLVKNMPHWKPAKDKGKPVRISYMLPIHFKLDSAILSFAEKMPLPPIEYIRKEVKKLYKPETGHSVCGKSYINAVLELDGSITQPEIVRSSGYRDLDSEALRIIKSIPSMTPASEKGKPVRVFYTVPVNFHP